ncbi:hypothetical protein S40288_05116 [Stachybotrys chartarum IBT 40288]|nr:hypothetical protein S40288_05116 [Stachybotrys chartarum IBT 40288]
MNVSENILQPSNDKEPCAHRKLWSSSDDDSKPPPVERAGLSKGAVTLACNPCRKRKSKCDGVKPACSPCASRQWPCVYRTPVIPAIAQHELVELQDTLQQYRRVLDLLRNAPDEEAAAMLSQLKNQDSLTEFVHALDTRSVPSLPSTPVEVQKAPDAAARLALGFDINIRFPQAFPRLDPIEISDNHLRLLSAGRATLSASRKRKRLRTHTASPIDPSTATKLSLPNLEARERLTPPALESIQAIDSRLQALKVQIWTPVNISSAFAARALSFYLVHEHPVLGLLDANLFIRDLVKGHGPFCSPLLVNSVLAWCCASYSQFEPHAATLSAALLEEAKTLWHQDKQRDSIINISAAVFLAITSNYHGMDRSGLTYLDAGAEIGSRLSLFDCADASTPVPCLVDDDTEVAASYAVWGAFEWHTVHSIYFRRRHRIKHPPTLPIPGDTFGPNLAPYMGSTFTWVSKFWLIVHETFRDGYLAYSRSSFSNAQSAYRKFLGWSESLPPDARRSEPCANHVLIMHIWYQTVLMDVWRPFLGTARQSVKAERDFSTAAFDTSLRQLKRLIFLYRKDHETTNRTILTTPGYVSLINEILRHSDTPDAHVSFILAMRGCLAVAPWSRGLNGITKALISLASQVKIFERPGWDVDTVESVRTEALGLASDGMYNSAYPIDLDLSREDIQTGSMEVLAYDFQELALLSRLKHRNERREEVVEDRGVWKGDPRDLTLTLSEATQDDI